MSGEKERVSGEQERETVPALPTVNPNAEKSEPASPPVHPAFYIGTWIALSSSVILFNKWILDTAKFHYPVILTTWHLTFATLMTQIMARTTTLLDSRKKVPMNGRVYLRAIVPIGIFFSLSLICGNLTYLYLSVAFIQMLKATTPVATLLASWGLGVTAPNMKILSNVSIIVFGVMIASFGEIKFVVIGVLFQIGGIIFESVRLVMVERLLGGGEFKMDPLVSLYYYAPCCAVMNGVVALFMELPRIQMSEVYAVGLFTLLMNAMVAFLLNVSVVFVIGKTSSLVLTLSGVLKDILLVVASVLIFGDPVTPLQMFGYSIALGGLLYYRLGVDRLKEVIMSGVRSWADYRARNPALSKIIVLVGALFFGVVLLGGLNQSGYDPREYAKSAKSALGQIVGEKGGMGAVTGGKGQ